MANLQATGLPWQLADDPGRDPNSVKYGVDDHSHGRIVECQPGLGSIALVRLGDIARARAVRSSGCYSIGRSGYQYLIAKMVITPGCVV